MTPAVPAQIRVIIGDNLTCSTPDFESVGQSGAVVFNNVTRLDAKLVVNNKQGQATYTAVVAAGGKVSVKVIDFAQQGAGEYEFTVTEAGADEIIGTGSGIISVCG